MKIAVISNFCLDIHFKDLLSEIFHIAEPSSITFFHSEEITEETLVDNAFFDLNIVWMSLNRTIDNLELGLLQGVVSIDECISDVSSKIKAIVSKLEKFSGESIWIGFEDYSFVTRNVFGNVYLPYFIANKANSILLEQDLNVIDVTRLIAEVGLENSLSLRNGYRWDAPYSKTLLNSVVSEVFNCWNALKNSLTKKLIVLDCDGVLWGGVLSEDGFGGVKYGDEGFGKYYKDFQSLVCVLRDQGIVLAISTKNDRSDIESVFLHREMLLKYEDFAIVKANWENKASNIITISETVGIALEDCVFVDDSLFEIENVKNCLPDVTAIHFDKNWQDNLSSLFNFYTIKSTDQSITRTRTYQQNEQRALLKMENTAEEFISKLNMKVEINLVGENEIERISELSRRTNRCTNGIRFSQNNIKALLKKNEIDILSVHLSDRYGALGLVGCMIVENKNHIVHFSLSCRALGRKVEDRMLDHMINCYDIESYAFCQTGKNNWLKAVLSSILCAEERVQNHLVHNF